MQLTPQTRFQKRAEWDSIAMVVTMHEEELGNYVKGDDVHPCATLKVLHGRLLERKASQ